MFTRITGFFAGEPHDDPVEACIAKAVEFMQKDIAIDRLIDKLENLGFALTVIQPALTKAAEIHFANLEKRIALNKEFSEKERKKYLHKMEMDKASYLAKLEGVF